MTDAAAEFDRRHQLSDALSQIGISPDSALINRLWIYTSLLLRWNRTYNLTGARDESTMVREHLLDSLAAVPVLSAGIRQEGNQPLLVDVGSGAGFPGIVVGIVHPNWPIALVEPIGKKTAFLRQACAALGLKQVHPIAARVETTEQALSQLATGLSGTRHFTCRAVATLTELMAMIRPVATEGSRLFALKSQHLDEELAPFPDASVHLLTIPGFEHPRTIVELPLMPTSGGNSGPAPLLR